MKAILIVLAVAVVIGVALLLTDDLNRAGLLTSQGSIDTGSHFAIEIGMDRTKAAAELEQRGLVPIELTQSQSCHGRSYPSDHKVELWQDQSWRRGTICIASKAGKVQSVSWWFDWSAP